MAFCWCLSFHHHFFIYKNLEFTTINNRGNLKNKIKLSHTFTHKKIFFILYISQKTKRKTIDSFDKKKKVPFTFVDRIVCVCVCPTNEKRSFIIHFLLYHTYLICRCVCMYACYSCKVSIKRRKRKIKIQKKARPLFHIWNFIF